MAEKLEVYAAREKEALGLARVSELREAGMKISDERVEVFAKEMSEKSDESFALLLEVAKNTAEATKNEALASLEKEDSASASDGRTIPADLAVASESEATEEKDVIEEEEDALDKIFAKAAKSPRI